VTARASTRYRTASAISAGMEPRSSGVRFSYAASDPLCRTCDQRPFHAKGRNGSVNNVIKRDVIVDRRDLCARVVVTQTGIRNMTDRKRDA